MNNQKDQSNNAYAKILELLNNGVDAAEKLANAYASVSDSRSNVQQMRGDLDNRREELKGEREKEVLRHEEAMEKIRKDLRKIESLSNNNHELLALASESLQSYKDALATFDMSDMSEEAVSERKELYRCIKELPIRMAELMREDLGQNS